MSDDSDEFFKRLGSDVPTFRTCKECGDIFLVNPDTYGKPKAICDPDYCENACPYCICQDIILETDRHLGSCSFPDCPRLPPDDAGREYEVDDDVDGFDDEDEC
jgi:hypothetical protein